MSIAGRLVVADVVDKGRYISDCNNVAAFASVLAPGQQRELSRRRFHMRDCTSTSNFYS